MQSEEIEKEIAQLKKEIIGKSVKDATKLCKLCSIRVVKEDGKCFAITMDWIFSRINVVVENGVIEKIHSTG